MNRGITTSSIFVAAAAAFGAAFSCVAQEYPARPVRMIVPFPPGGGTDYFGRIIAQKLTENLGATFVVDNRGGAGGIIGTEVAAKSKPDGYTIILVSTSHAINPSLHRKLPFDPARDFAPVTMLASGPLLLVVHPSLPARNVRELITLAKARPGMLAVASAGNGTPPHLAVELFKTMTRVDMVHVPYKGNGPAYTDLIAGQVPVMFPSITTALPIAKSGKVRALAVTSAARSRIAPDEFAKALAAEIAKWNRLARAAGIPQQ
ncbi:MAG: tripartite tricarboxylate transporter substrate binding protein [Betaproteobacteria bacterium]|nr:tripartite tricarboxylate transporter substrate binding protein [Betaproteobacteria bacterium]